MTEGSEHHDNDRSRRPIVRAVRTLFIILGILLALYFIGVLSMRAVSINQLQEAQDNLHAFGRWWMILRIGFIAGLAIYWHEINTWLARRNQWSEAHLERVLAGRWLMLGVLCFVELFLIQRIHEPFTDRILQ